MRMNAAARGEAAVWVLFVRKDLRKRLRGRCSTEPGKRPLRRLSCSTRSWSRMCSPARSVTGNQRRDKSGFISKVSWLSLEAQQLCHVCGQRDMAWVAV